MSGGEAGSVNDPIQQTSCVSYDECNNHDDRQAEKQRDRQEWIRLPPGIGTCSGSFDVGRDVSRICLCAILQWCNGLPGLICIPGRTVEQRLVGGRLKLHPANTGEIDIRPGMGILFTDDVLVRALKFPLGKADCHAGRNAHNAQHDHFRGGIVIAKSSPVVNEEPDQRVGPIWCRLDRCGISDGFSKVIGNGCCFIKRCFRVRGYLPGKFGDLG